MPETRQSPQRDAMQGTVRVPERLADAEGAVMADPLKIYCDTSVLISNIADQKSVAELDAMRELGSMFPMRGSLLVRRELMDTRDLAKRDRLAVDWQKLEPIEHDEKVVGFNTVYAQFGGFAASPLVSDVQDEVLHAELTGRGLSPKDAEHIAQAISNGCNVFLTRYKKTVITPYREWLERRFPALRIRSPAELLAELRPVSTRSPPGG